MMKSIPTFKLARLLLCLALLLPVTLRAQQAPVAAPDEQDEVIRLNTELVQLRAVVTDKNGQFVDNLRREDFEVFENGQPREINFFSVEQVAADGGTAQQTTGETPVAEARTTPERQQQSATVARTIVLFVDTIHLSPASLMRTKTQLKRFVDEQLTDRDLVAVVATSGTLGVLQQFMRDRRMLKYAIDKLTHFPGLRSSITPYLAMRVLSEDQQAIQDVIKILGTEEGYTSLSPEAASNYANSRARSVLIERANLRRATLQTLGAVCEMMAGMRGQRLLTFVSDGFSLLDEGGNRGNEEFSNAVSRAVRAGVMIYPIYPRGLVGPGDLTSGAVPGSQEGGIYMLESQTDVKMNLREIAEATGGEAYLNTNDLSASFRKMLDANRAYYSLAYYLPKESDKKFRKISLRVKGHPEYAVRTQRGYMPPTGREATVASTPRERLFKAMLAPLPMTAIGVTSSADFLEREGDDAQVTLQVRVDGNRLKYEPRGQDHLLRCEMAVVVFDKSGAIADSFSESVNAVLTPQQLEQARRTGYRYSRRLSLKPGLYQVRVGVREVGSELTGTSMSWVEVPDLRKKKFALSSIFLAKEQSGEKLDGAQAASGRQQPANPKLIVGSATIKSGEAIFYRFVVYNAATATASAPDDAGVTVKVDVMQGATPIHEGNWQPLNSRVIRRDGKGIEAGGQMRIRLSPGVYTLRVTVRDARSKKTVEQTADFETEA